MVPSIWLLDVANGFLTGERRRRITSAEVLIAVGECLELPLFVREVGRVEVGPILALARAHNLTAYDAAYLDLALRERLPLATLDEDLRAAATTTGVPILT
jgi:predicted nucleic acid-binding protein